MTTEEMKEWFIEFSNTISPRHSKTVRLEIIKAFDELEKYRSQDLVRRDHINFDCIGCQDCSHHRECNFVDIVNEIPRAAYRKVEHDYT